MSNLRQYNITVPAAAGNTDTSILNGLTVTGVHYIKTTLNGGAGDTALVAKVSDADVPVVTTISAAASLNVNDQVIVGPNALLIDDSAYSISATDTIRVTTAQATNCACQAIITGIPNTA
tara:strand:+ start:95 stop:454 length:360 start_codon:yes stop_codon:yes gene_type:complete